MNIACYRYRMTPEETLTAATLNAAAAIGRADRVGTVETGKVTVGASECIVASRFQ